MSTISASTTTTTAYKVTADTTGALVLQTGATPTTAVTIDTSQNTTFAGTVSATSFTGSGSGITGLSQEVGQCRLNYTSTTVLTLVPYGGQYIKIAGAIYAIPSAGVTLSNSGLSASTLYYIYAYISGGNVTLSASATAYATDTTAGNVGVVIRSGNNAYTLVGMAYTTSGSLFIDDASNRQVLSYFNRTQKFLFGTAGNFSSTSTTMVVATTIFINSLCWADDGICVWMAGQSGMTGSFALQQAIFDNNTANTYGISQYVYGPTGSLNMPVLLGGWHNPTEGRHSYYVAYGAVSGSGTVSINNCTATGYVNG
jgi:hypothetical protein